MENLQRIPSEGQGRRGVNLGHGMKMVARKMRSVCVGMVAFLSSFN